MKFELRRDAGILILEPMQALTEADFAEVSAVVDPYLDAKGTLSALVIHTPDFPGWSNFAGLLAHLRFVKEHRDKTRKIALVTDSVLGSIAPTLAGLFTSAEIRHFPYGDFNKAIEWTAA
jgi:hypothetical protein